MPEPSILPIVNAVGVALSIVGAHALDRGHRHRAGHLPRDARRLGPRRSARDLRAPAGSLLALAAVREYASAHVGVEQPDVSSPEARRPSPSATRRRSPPISAEGGESGLGEAYALGREAVAAQLSVLDLADAHHRALTRRAGLARRRPPGARSCAPARSSCARASRPSRSSHRGYLEVQEVARIEHEYVEQLRALADASVAINSSLTVEEILQLTADAARAVLGAARASIAILAAGAAAPRRSARPRRRDLEGAMRDTRALERRACRRGAASSASLEVVDQPGARVHAARRGDPHPARPARRGGDRQRAASTTASARSRARSSARCGPARCPTCPASPPPCASTPAGEGIELGGDFYDLFRAARRRLGGADRRRPGQGPGGRRGDRARPPHAARRGRLRAPPERRARRCCTARCASRRRRAASAPSPTPTCSVAPATARARARLRRPPAAARRAPRRPRRARRPARHAAGHRHRAAARPTSPSSSSPATCSCSTPTASPRCAAAGARCSAPRADRAARGRAAACRPTRSPSASRRPCSTPRRAGCATTWRSSRSGPTPGPTRRICPDRSRRRRRWLTRPRARATATATARPAPTCCASWSPTCARTARSCARSGRAGSARRSC